MGAAMILKDRHLFSIFTVYLFSLISLVFALFLSWADKSNTIYFLISSFMLAFLGAVLSTNKTLSLSDAAQLLDKFRSK